MRKLIAGTAVGLAALASAGIGGTAFAVTPPPQSGTVSGSVTVATALTLQLTGTSFTVNGATPGVSDNGVPATTAKVFTNDDGYTLSTYMNDGTPTYPACSSPGDAAAFENSGGTVSIPDNAWTDTSTGGPGAPGTPQTYQGQPALSNGQSGCLAASAQAMTVGQSNTQSAATGDVFNEQLAVTVPANTPGGVLFTGTLTYLATGA
jgi:hypothetical protein